MIVMTSMVELESLFGHLFDALSNGENQVVTKSSAVTTADASDKCQQQQDSTSSTSTLATTITADGNFDFQNRRDLPRSTPLDRVEVLDEVSSDDNEVTEVKALIDLTDEEIVYVSKESVRNGEWIKISLEKKQSHVKTLGREEVKPVSKKITMLDHSKAEQMGILKDVLCQVGVTTILAKFLILDIPVDKDVLIVVRKNNMSEKKISQKYAVLLTKVLMTMYEAKHQRICECWLGYCANGSREQEMEFRLLDTTTLRELIDSSERLIAEEPAPGDPRVATTPFYF
ncbi:hypothetical protein Tco_0770263 [Tanacetum coccineum]|uniref:Uncharacterized protein n=1 Tax=Tanacetum coccineum TaxID=301880 RepID=A0ABQ4ZFA3_9ASTR